MELSEARLLAIQEGARKGELPDADTVMKLVEQARQLDFISTSVMFQRLQDVNELLKRLLNAEEDPLILQRSLKRCSTHLDEIHGACVKYKNGWPSAHIRY